MWPFSKKTSPGPTTLAFKSGEAFVDYHCKYMVTQLEAGSPLAALVLDARKHFGTGEAVKVDEQGNQTVVLRVASNDGGFIALASTASGRGDRLKPGDAVAWVPGQHMPELAKASGDVRTGWVGLVVAKVAPEIDMAKGQMTILCRY